MLMPQRGTGSGRLPNTSISRTVMAPRSFATPALVVGFIRLISGKIELTSNAAIEREEQSDLLPSLRDEQTEKVIIWRPLPPGRPEHIAEMDWERPRP
jgi:hypothetical protein